MRHLLFLLHERKITVSDIIQVTIYDTTSLTWEGLLSLVLVCWAPSAFLLSQDILHKLCKWGLRHAMFLKQNSLPLWIEQKSPKPTEQQVYSKQSLLQKKKKLSSKLNRWYKIKLSREGIFVPGTLRYNCRDMMWLAILCKTWVLIMVGTTIYNQFHHPYHHLHLHHLH